MRRDRLWPIFAVGVLLLGSAAAPAVGLAAPATAPASAPASFTVNSLNDAVADFGNDPNFTVCHTSPANTTCTLRAAIMNANRHAGGATINLPAGTYTLAILPDGPDQDDTGNLDITSTVTVVGAGAAGVVLDGAGIDGLFHIQSGGALTLSGASLRNGAAGFGGALLNQGELSLSNVVLRGNHGFTLGGALANFHNATLTDVTIEGNTSAGLGGGISNGGTLTVTRSTIDGNTAALRGGGIVNDVASTLTVFDSTLSNNSAAQDGGGLYNDGAVRIFQTTLAGNLADNRAVGGHTGGGIYNNAGINSVQVWNSLLSNNFAASIPSQCAGNGLHSQGYNYINLNGSCTLNGVTTGNLIVFQDPLLGLLADNGGPTWTRAQAPGSPVVDQIPPGVCQDPLGTAPVPDQRGVARPIGPQCDMGAFEGTLATPIYLHNLVRNGGAEASAGSPNGAVVGTPDWHNFFLPSTQLTEVTYNAVPGFPSVPTDTVPANHGANFFAGGYLTTSVGNQIISLELAGINTSIDAGQVHFLLAADLGGFGSQNDQASVTLQFLNHGGQPVGALTTLDGPNAIGRGLATSLLPFSKTGVVPANTRAALITVTLTRTSGPGTYNDAYADNISFMLLPTGAVFLPLVTR